MKTTSILATLCLTLCVLTAAAAPATGERAAAYKSFRENFDARRFAEALAPAQTVLQLSEQQFGAEQMELVTPLANVGTVQLRLKDYAAAELSFLRAIKIVEAREGGFSRSIIQPLLGLGMTYSSAGQHADAVQRLRRAIDVSRRVDGLFNAAQIQLVDPLIQSYSSLEQLADMEREQQYLLRLAETTYGVGDERMLPVFERNAYWYEDAGRFASARGMYFRMIDVVRRAHKGDKDPKDLRFIAPLRAIARTYKQEFIFGMEVRKESDSGIPSFSNNSNLSYGGMDNDPNNRINDDGRRSLESAVRILKDLPEATPQLRGETALDLGDWYLASGNRRDALAIYKEAWKELTAAGSTAFNTPSQILYRGPTGSFRRPPAAIEEFDSFYVETEFTVDKDGAVKNAKAADSDASDSQRKSAVTAIGRARYRPRFVEGEPVDTEKVRYRQTLFTKKKKSKDKDQG